MISRRRAPCARVARARTIPPPVPADRPGGDMFRGSLVALVTPMTESGDVDHVAFGRLLDWHAREGSDGVVVGGTTGESATLTAAEVGGAPADRGAAARRAPARDRGHRRRARLRSRVERTRAACELGADGVLVVTPYYNRPPQEGLYRHFSVIADASSVPLILYNVPSRTACDLLPETVERLVGPPADHRHQGGDRQHRARPGNPRALRRRFPAALGRRPELPRADRRGRAGRHHGHRQRRAAAHARDGRSGARSTTRRAPGNSTSALSGLHTALFVESNPIPAKWALGRLGLIGPGIRLPLVGLSEPHHATVLAAMRRAGVIE